MTSRMLANLKEALDDIEQADEWAHTFVTDMLIKQEEALASNPGERMRLTDKQFKKLVEIHERYCAHGR